MLNGVPNLAELHAMPQMQQPSYPDPAAVADVVSRLRGLPPLVFAGECDDLRDKLAAVADGRGFLLQGGDCAETFAGVNADNIKGKLRVLLSMAVVMTYAAQVPVVKVGRIAGQYAKPRSKDTETRNGVTLPSYRGDAVNGFEFTPESRTHDPRRLLQIYNSSAATLNLVRAFVKGGFADLRGINAWNADFVRNSNVEARYEALAHEIESALAFMIACGVDDEQLSTVDFYASHEALLLDYEHAMTRIDSRSQLPYDTSGHLLWIGERTRQPDGAHVAFMRRVNNPLGIKLGPSTSGEDAVLTAELLDPDRIPGRITFITRMGAGNVREKLPPIIDAVESTGRKVVWTCDPMHGNTFESANGFKTRSFVDVCAEVNAFFDVHEEMGTWPGGVHVELTGDDVTECLGGVDALDEADLANRYETACDPRLNRNQSLELAFMIAERLSDGRLKRHAVSPLEPFRGMDM
ncbi:MAG: 3-deoxy-7-phosphoheptulonate synthase class II [Acidipropionibacterium acidipropionici]|jgi:3-deoxy-7-phosphoheptulonate synthase|uniref:Phospho-2-dehydro-3-deoxyheptonate aldolase n=2 Tax=Acidipropionibacterium acidipropionici TaxID=1748 RepID=A0AAC8YHL8_9ACTN|nr:3-deoxy-7-phosphoheptulonate synthase class II [Acidipropionibacterium acidipropionici]AMS06755.1 phospho-2-dehydro-3-deoxyheptonate aldolase [Acidipropionibacterium acidipropionici]AOZ45545.1 3-deoxy-7-phosphoheptulonate synthase [Acidipropionibacterium acidipropionici]AZP38447.1 3-deoxy-7-phosphoheptulonate synthase class II [Acidipropionibacterium acidipropionici]QCV95392.1 3-deoxy-7-phosphoheptulonate synthase class II [Acidipropionibacterium acidipropionici]